MSEDSSFEKWTGLWNSKKYPKILAKGTLEIRLKKPYDEPQTYDTTVIVKYLGGYGVFKAGSKDYIPLHVETAIKDFHDKNNLNFNMKGNFKNLQIEYDVKKFSETRIEGKYSVKGTVSDFGEFWIQPEKVNKQQQSKGGIFGGFL